jgi:hypothetical protein
MTFKSLAPIGLAAAALLVAVFALFNAGQVEYQEQGVTNLDSLHLSDSGGTATPVFIANQSGSGVIAEFQDGGTPVARFNDGGGFEFQSGGSFDLNGQTLTIDADADSTLAGSTDDVITITIGAATGRANIATGNLKVGNGTSDDTLNGEDAYIEGTFEVDGAANFDGAVDIDGNLTSATGAVTVADTLDVSGNVSSGTGAFTVADTINVTGNATFDADLIVDDTFNIDDTAYSSVGAQTLDPTASVYLLSPATTLTLTLATTTSVAGDFVWFVSTVATDTVIVDTTATAGGGNRTLGTAGDVIGFIYNGSVWAEAFFSDNS